LHLKNIKVKTQMKQQKNWGLLMSHQSFASYLVKLCTVLIGAVALTLLCGLYMILFIVLMIGKCCKALCKN